MKNMRYDWTQKIWKTCDIFFLPQESPKFLDKFRHVGDGYMHRKFENTLRGVSVQAALNVALNVETRETTGHMQMTMNSHLPEIITADLTRL